MPGDAQVNRMLNLPRRRVQNQDAAARLNGRPNHAFGVSHSRVRPERQTQVDATNELNSNQVEDRQPIVWRIQAIVPVAAERHEALGHDDTWTPAQGALDRPVSRRSHGHLTPLRERPRAMIHMALKGFA